MKPLLLTPLLFFMISIISCRKTQDSLPAATSVGANTIGFKVNGTAYTASGKAGQLLSAGFVTYYYYATNNSLFISAKRTAGDNQFGLWLSIPYKDSVGTYWLNNDFKGTFFQGGNPNPNDPSGGSIYTTTDTYTGKVNITYFDGKLDPYYPGKILSGTFEMQAVNDNGDVIQITEGRFDIGN